MRNENPTLPTSTLTLSFPYDTVFEKHSKKSNEARYDYQIENSKNREHLPVE